MFELLNKEQHFLLNISVFATDKKANLDLPADMKSSILSLKGCRCSSDELVETFSTSFSQAGQEETRNAKKTKDSII